MEKLKKYVPFSTIRIQLKVEDSFCGSVEVLNPNTPQGKIEKHDVNTDFDYKFSSDTWDN
jgi:hypothetical protein